MATKPEEICGRDYFVMKTLCFVLVTFFLESAFSLKIYVISDFDIRVQIPGDSLLFTLHQICLKKHEDIIPDL